MPDIEPRNITNPSLNLSGDVLERLRFVKWLAEQRNLIETSPHPEMITPPDPQMAQIEEPLRRPVSFTPQARQPEKPWDGLMGGI